MPRAPRKASAGGPRTAAGKARSAQNARKHGLDRPAALDPVFAPAIERLAKAYAGEGAGQGVSPGRLARARALAAAEMDLRRIARARLDLFRQAIDRRRPSTRDLIKAHARLQSGPGDGVARGVAASLLHPADPMDDPATAARLIGQLFALERYERRAFSRRRAAMRGFEALVVAASRYDPDAPGKAGTGEPGRAAVSPEAADAGRPAEPGRSARPSSVAAGVAARHRDAPEALDQLTPLAGAGEDDAHPDPAQGARAVIPPAGGVDAAAIGRLSDAALRPSAVRPTAPDIGPIDADPGPGVILAERTPDAARAPADGDAPNPDEALVTKLAFAGLAPELIARRLGLSVAELRRRHAHALEHGPEFVIALVAAALVDEAIGGDTRAATFILKARAGWRESGPVRGPPAPGPAPEQEAEKARLIDRIIALLDAPRRQEDKAP